MGYINFYVKEKKNCHQTPPPPPPRPLPFPSQFPAPPREEESAVSLPSPIDRVYAKKRRWKKKKERKKKTKSCMQNRRLSAGENSAIVNGVSKERARAKQPWPKALARHPLSAPSLVTRRDEPVRGTERCPCVGPRGRKKRQEKEEREREREGKAGRRRSNRQTQAPSSSFFSFCFSPFVPRCARLLFLLLLSFAHGSCHAGDRAESKPPMRGWQGPRQ